MTELSMRRIALGFAAVSMALCVRAATPVVDILVIYTTAAKNGAGSADKLIASIGTQINSTNTIFKNSGINATVRLIATQETTDFQESGDVGADLRTLTNASYFPGFGALPGPANPQSDPIHALRDQVGADIVVLVEENTMLGSQVTAGYSNISVQSGVAIPEFAYSIVQRSNITIGGYAFPHELGHVFGCRHDQSIEFPNSVGAYPYSYGWHWTAGSTLYCDIMGQVSGSTAVLQFSNPNLLYKGVATGVADQADNARTINMTAPMLEAYRAGAPAGPGPVDSTTDTDGDGFPDELETALNTSPTDAASTPFGGSPATPQPLTLSTFALKLNLVTSNADKVSCSGLLPAPANVLAAGQTVVLDIGGVIQSFTLNDKGMATTGSLNNIKLRVKATKGIIATPQAKFTAQFSKGSFAGKFTDENMDGSTDASSAARTVQVIVLFNATMYTTIRNVTYSAKAGKSAAAK